MPDRPAGNDGWKATMMPLQKKMNITSDRVKNGREIAKDVSRGTLRSKRSGLFGFFGDAEVHGVVKTRAGTGRVRERAKKEAMIYQEMQTIEVEDLGEKKYLADTPHIIGFLGFDETNPQRFMLCLETAHCDLRDLLRIPVRELCARTEFGERFHADIFTKNQHLRRFRASSVCIFLQTGVSFLRRPEERHDFLFFFFLKASHCAPTVANDVVRRHSQKFRRLGPYSGENCVSENTLKTLLNKSYRFSKCWSCTMEIRQMLF
jgi:hypothetical protein